MTPFPFHARYGRHLACFILILLAFLGAELRSAGLRAFEITHPHERTIHAWHVDELAGSELDRSGSSDVSAALNDAIRTLFDQGGGTLYLPAGKYRLDRPVFVRPGIALRGDFAKPGTGEVEATRNTIFCAYYGRGMGEQADPLFFLDGSSLIDGVVIWYPEQRSEEIVPYAPAIRFDNKDSMWAINSAARNVFLVNAYTGIQLGKLNQGTCIQLVKNVYGTPLKDGVEVWRDADIPRILDVDFNPDFWPDSSLGDVPVDRTKLAKHLFENASGITYHRCDGSELANIKIRGYHKGLNLGDGHVLDNGAWLDNEGHYINFEITGCYYAVWIQNIKNHGTQFYNCILEGAHSAVFIENPMHGKECAMFMGCELRGGKAAISQSWKGQPNDLFSLMFTACAFGSPIDWTGGNLIVTDCDFEFVGRHIFLGPKTGRAIVSDSRFRGDRNIDNRAGERLILGDPRSGYIKPPAYEYDANRISRYHPPQSETVILDAGDGRTDDAGRLQGSIDRLSQRGGGYVVLKPGAYLLDSQLIVRENVELRGPVQSWQHSKFLSYYAEKGTPKGALVYVRYGFGDVDGAAIVMEENAGLDGLFFHYPGQEYSTETKTVLRRYSWLIRIKGDRAYVKHVTASNPWRFIDVYTHDPKNNYIGYCTGAPLDQGIRVGEAENCFIDNVHFNSWYWNTVYFPNQPSRSEKGYGYKKELDNWMKASTKAFVFAGSRNVDVYGSFTFCAKQGFTLLPGKRSRKGPSGIIINSGNDWSKYGLYMHANDGLVFANMHFIDVGKFDSDQSISSIYVAEDCRDTVELFNVSTWGDSPRTLTLKGSKESGVSIYNLSYQLYDRQENIIEGGKALVVGAIRNVPKLSTLFEMGDDASLVLRSSLFPTELSISPDQVRADLQDAEADFRDTDHQGVFRSLSFP